MFRNSQNMFCSLTKYNISCLINNTIFCYRIKGYLLIFDQQKYFLISQNPVSDIRNSFHPSTLRGHNFIKC